MRVEKTPNQPLGSLRCISSKATTVVAHALAVDLASIAKLRNPDASVIEQRAWFPGRIPAGLPRAVVQRHQRKAVWQLPWSSNGSLVGSAEE